MSTGIDLSQSPAQRIEYGPESTTQVITYHGSYAECTKQAEAYAEKRFSQDGNNKNDALVSSIAVTRLNAARGQLEVTSRAHRKLAFYGLSFIEISKPIRTWLKEKQERDKSSSGSSGSSDDAETMLTHIQSWEHFKDEGNSGLTSYCEYKYIDGGKVKKLEGDELALAKKIRQGIESYSSYAPVVTCAVTSDKPPNKKLDSIGKYEEKLVVTDSEYPESNSEFLASLSAMAKYWLKQSDAIQSNSDGSFTRTEQWQGLTWIDSDLYEIYSSKSGSGSSK